MNMNVMQGIKIKWDDLLCQDSPGANSNVVNSSSIGNELRMIPPVSHLLVVWCLLISPVPPRAFVLRSPLRLSIMPSAGSDFFQLHSLSAARLCYPVLPVVEGSIQGWPPYLIQWVKSSGWATRELIQGLKYSGSSLTSWLKLSPANLIYREDFPSLYT